MENPTNNGFMQPAQASTPDGEEAVAILRADQQRLRRLFDAYRAAAKSTDDGGSRAIVLEICDEFLTYATVEEEILHPAARAVAGESGPLAQLLKQAEPELTSAKELVAQLRAMQAGDSQSDALMAKLEETMLHHAQHEEDELFPLARRAGVDTTSLGAKILELKGELQARQLPDQQPGLKTGQPEGDVPPAELARRQFGNA